MNELRQLAVDWLDCSESDEQDADRSAVKEVQQRMKVSAQVRRNCAWELQRLLRQLDKENPPSGGLLVPHADSESV